MARRHASAAGAALAVGLGRGGEVRDGRAGAAVRPALAARVRGHARRWCWRWRSCRSSPTAACASSTTGRSATRRAARRRSASGVRWSRSAGSRTSRRRRAARARPARGVRPATPDLRQIAALGAAILIAVELTATHWFYLYVVWFVPFVFVALFAAHGRTLPEAAAEHAPEPRARGGARVRRAALLAVAVLVAGWALTLWVAPWSDERVNDLFVYRTFAEPVLDGGLPYRDVGIRVPAAGGARDRAARPGRHRRGGVPVGVRRLDARRRRPRWCCCAARWRARTGGDRAARHARRRAHAALLRRAAPHALRPRSRSRCSSPGCCCSCRERPRAGLAVLGLGGDDEGCSRSLRCPWRSPGSSRAGGAARRGRARSRARAVIAVGGGRRARGVAGRRARRASATTSTVPCRWRARPRWSCSAWTRVGAGEAESVASHRSDGLLHPAADAVTSLFAAASWHSSHSCAPLRGAGSGWARASS